MNVFKNPNAENILKWFFRTSDNLNQIVFYFLSHQNATSARYFCLFEASRDIRIVYLKGINFPYSDYVMLKLYRILLLMSHFKINSYKIFHNISRPIITKSDYQVLHIDDPEYSHKEKHSIIEWEFEVKSRGKRPIIICTNQFSKNYFQNFLRCKVLVISQGFVSDIRLESDLQKNTHFSCVYSSPYIHIGSDKHANHPTWGAELLINTIIPKICNIDESLEIHLIGELGIDAKKELNKYDNVVCHGRVDFYTNMAIIRSCHIAIYPRKKDLFRSMLKIFSYLGADLPIVTFDLVDTSVVKEMQFGLSVSTVDEFIEGIFLFKSNKVFLKQCVSRIRKSKNNFSWESLANKMNNELNSI